MKTSKGFTVIELLIVIAIIAVIASLLIPAVQAAREAARRSQCVNNLKQLALGCLNHESALKVLPTAGWGPIGMGHPDAGTGITQPGGWLYNIMPYIEESALYKSQGGLTGTPLQSAAIATAMTPLKVMYCPSRRPVQTYPQLTWLPNIKADTMTLVNSVLGTAQAVLVYDASATSKSASLASGLTSVARSDYAGNGYHYDQYPMSTDPFKTFIRTFTGLGPSNSGEYQAAQYLSNTTTAEQLKKQLVDPAVDPEYTLGHRSGIFAYLQTISVDQITDGASNTYLCGEKYINVEHYADGQDPGDDWCGYTGYDWEMVRFTDPSIGPPCQDSTGILNGKLFGSAHPTVCNMAFCDGSVHSISYGISAAVHDQLGNRNDGAAIDMSLVNP